MGSGSGGGSGCFIANITAPLIAQGTVTGLLLAALVWTGAGLLGLLLLGILIAILLGLCALCSGPWCPGDCGCGDSGGDSCGGGQGGGSACCDDCCDPGGSGGSGAGGSGGSGGGGTGGGGGGGTGGGGSGGMLVALVATRLGLTPRDVRLLGNRLAHHPDTADYAADVYRAGALRLCIGCFTTFPVFLATAALLFVARPDIGWVAASGLGATLAGSQALSSAGWARTRAIKAAVKTALGAGLALFVFGVLTSPWSPALRFLALAAMLALAVLSTVPRRRRMRASGSPSGAPP